MTAQPDATTTRHLYETAVGAALTLRFADGSQRTVEIDPDMHPDVLAVVFTQHTDHHAAVIVAGRPKPRRYQLTWTLHAEYDADADAAPRTFYRLSRRDPQPATERT